MFTYLRRTHWIFIALIVLAFIVMLPTASVSAQETTPTPVPPTEIPEPITVILFGTGLAALSAASALKRSNKE